MLYNLQQATTFCFFLYVYFFDNKVMTRLRNERLIVSYEQIYILIDFHFLAVTKDDYDDKY